MVDPFIFGVVAAMEEENANNEEFDISSINAVKASLMGPLAGIGDSLFWGTLRPLAGGIACSLALAGNFLHQSYSYCCLIFPIFWFVILVYILDIIQG